MYQALREGSPVLELPDANMLVLTRYEDIQTTLRDRTLGHADDSMMTEAQLAEINANAAIRGLRETMLLKNPPDHTRLRGLVVKAFDARRTEAMRERIRAIPNELVDGFIEARGFWTAIQLESMRSVQALMTGKDKDRCKAARTGSERMQYGHW